MWGSPRQKLHFWLCWDSESWGFIILINGLSPQSQLEAKDLNCQPLPPYRILVQFLPRLSDTCACVHAENHFDELVTTKLMHVEVDFHELMIMQLIILELPSTRIGKLLASSFPISGRGKWKIKNLLLLITLALMIAACFAGHKWQVRPYVMTLS